MHVVFNAYIKKAHTHNTHIEEHRIKLRVTYTHTQTLTNAYTRAHILPDDGSDNGLNFGRVTALDILNR